MKKKPGLFFCWILIFMLIFTVILSINVFAVSKISFYELENYILPNSSKNIVIEADLYNLSRYEIDTARNEIYARHGYIFKNESYAAYFTGKPWYKKNPKFKESQLSNIEKKNIQFLYSYSARLSYNFQKISETQCSIDLNGDGIKDIIKLDCQIGDDNFELSINDKTVSGSGDNLDGIMYITDIDKKDKYKEIAITESGPSNDNMTSFYYYDGSRVVFMGKVQGGEYSIKINGTGIFSTRTRGLILQTWFYTDEYKLSPIHKLLHIPEKYRKMNTIVTVKKQLELQKSPADSTPALTLHIGEKVILTDTDNIEWCAVETANGQKGWFNTADLSKSNSFPQDYFEGLCMAD